MSNGKGLLGQVSDLSARKTAVHWYEDEPCQDGGAHRHSKALRELGVVRVVDQVVWPVIEGVGGEVAITVASSHSDLRGSGAERGRVGLSLSLDVGDCLRLRVALGRSTEARNVTVSVFLASDDFVGHG